MTIAIESTVFEIIDLRIDRLSSSRFYEDKRLAWRIVGTKAVDLFLKMNPLGETLRLTCGELEIPIVVNYYFHPASKRFIDVEAVQADESRMVLGSKL